MNPTDNPKRPRHRFWFGPMTMIQYMMDTGILPGVTTDISMLPAKLGIQGALTDIQNNHPNDLVSMLMFSRPHYSGEPTEAGQFTYPVNSLSNNYTSMINSLWFPPNSSSADVTPWDANGLNTPHAHGDYDANTATSYGLMLAYNQFSSNSYPADLGSRRRPGPQGRATAAHSGNGRHGEPGQHGRLCQQRHDRHQPDEQFLLQHRRQQRHAPARTTRPTTPSTSPPKSAP